MSRTKITYEDITPYALEHSTFSTTDKQDFINLNQLVFPIGEYQDLALLLKKYIKLDGTKKNLPTSFYNLQWGLLSKSKTLDDGTFASPIVLEITTSNLYSTMGLTLIFNSFDNSWVNNLEIEFSQDSVVIFKGNYTPDDVQYFAQAQVTAFNKISITFYSMNKPDRFLWLQEFIYGVVRTFKEDELVKVNIYNEILPDGSDIGIDNLNFELVVKDNINYMFQRMQPIKSYHNNKLQITSYVDTAERTTTNKYNINCNGITSILDNFSFWGGMYTNVQAINLINQIAQLCNIAIEVDDSLKGKTLTGYLPISTCRAALADIVFAIGGIECSTKSPAIKIIAPKTEVVSHFGESRCKGDISVKQTESVISEVHLMSYAYSQSSETIQLFQGNLTGQSTIKFSEPAYNLAITGGTILSNGTNYAVIQGNGTVTLNGKKYIKTEKLNIRRNPLITANELGSVKEFTDYTLISDINVQEILELVYNNALKNQEITATVILEDEQVGDIVSFDTVFGFKQGIITKLDINSYNYLIGKVTVLV